MRRISIVDGEVPRDLNGTFYRNGPNPQFAPRGHHHWFGGDGMVHAFTLHDGRVSYRNRWARTIKWKTRTRGRRGAVRRVQSDGLRSERCGSCRPTASPTRTSSGTRGKLLALEEGHAPFEMDPNTLESIGAWTFDGKLVGPMTAHPKIDPETGEMIFFGYNATGVISADMSFHVVDRNGKLTRSETFTRAVRGDGARLHGHARSRDLPDHAANGFDGARDARRAGVCVGTGNRHADRHHAAQRHPSRTCAGSRATRRTSSIR